MTLIPIHETFETIQGEGYWAGSPVSFIRLQGCPVSCHFCFAAGTMVLMSDLSEKTIEDIQQGDVVLALENGKLVHSAVTEVHPSRLVDVLQLEFASGKKTVCTPEHQYKLTSEGKLRQAVSLKYAYAIDIPEIPELQELDIHYQQGYLVGAVLGDGCRWVDTRGYLHCRFNVCDVDFLERVQQCAKFLGWSPGEILPTPLRQGRKQAYNLDINSQNAIEAFNYSVVDFEANWQLANDSYRRGFLGGFFDAEGTFGCHPKKWGAGGNYVAFSQKTDKRVIDIAQAYIESQGFEVSRPISRSGMTILNVLGGWRNHVKFLSLVNPASARKNRGAKAHGRLQRLQKDPVVGRVMLGHQRVYNFATEHGYYFANGHYVKNCDTGYADGGKHTPRTDRSIDDLVSETKSPRVVISGGEPFIHKQLPALVEALELAGKQVCIETSGAFWQPVSATAWVTLSPKQHVSSKYPVHPAMWLRADEIKIVIATGVEVDFYDRNIRYWSTDWQDWANQHLSEFEEYLQRFSPTQKIFLQPEWNDRDLTLPLTLDLLQQHPNMRLSVQLHKLIGVQ